MRGGEGPEFYAALKIPGSYYETNVGRSALCLLFIDLGAPTHVHALLYVT